MKNNKLKRIKFSNLILVPLCITYPFVNVCILTACNNDPVQPEFTVANVTELVQKYEGQTKEFLNNEVLEKAISDTLSNYDQAKVLGSTFDLGDGNSKLLDAVNVIYTYKGEGNNRSFGISNVDFNKDIELTKVAKYSENKTELSSAVDNSKVTTQTVTYDALEQSQNDALAEALFKNVVNSDKTATQLVLKNNGTTSYPIEGGVIRYTCNKYELTAHTTTGVTSYNMYVKAQDNVQDMIASLSNPKNYKLDKTTNLATLGTTVVGKKYEKENIEKPPVIETIQNVEDLLEKNLTQAQNFLNAQTNEIAQQLGAQNSQNINFIRYDFGSNELTELNSIGFEMVIADPNVKGKETYYKGKAIFGSPVDLNEIANETAKAKIANVITEQFQYSAKEMFYKQGIVDALKEVAGITADTPVMVNFGTDNAGQTKFTMKAITENGLHDYELTVKTGANMAETIENIKTAGMMDSEKGSQLENGYTEKEYVAQKYIVESIEEALALGSDQIELNLNPVFEFMVNNIVSRKLQVINYTYDLGEPVNNKIDKMLIYIEAKNKNNQNIINKFVYQLTLPEQLDIQSLVDNVDFSKLSTTNFKQIYLYSYDTTKQGDKDDFIKAVVGQFDPDFNTEGATLLYTEKTQGMQTRNFIVVAISKQGIREYTISIPNTITDDKLADINSYTINLGTDKSVDFSNNQINVKIPNEAEQTNYEEYGL